MVAVEISLRYIEIDGDLCTLCIGRDTTKRRAAEAALRASEEKFEQVFTRSPDGIVILKQGDLTVYDINDSFLAASEYARDELIGRSVYELNVFIQDDALSTATEELTQNGSFSNREVTFRTKNGHIVQTLLSATYIEINGEPCVLCIAKNVNDLRQAEEKLRQSEQRFRGAFENSPVGIVLIDLEGNIFQTNHFASEVLGYESAALEGKHISRLIPQEDRSQFKETLMRLLEGSDDTVRTERRMLREDNLEIWTNFHIVMQRDSDGKPLYLIGQIADITEMKSSQSRMERMAFYDTLTNLANRRLFYDRLGQAVDHAQRSKHLSALLYLDLDQFKRVNDTLGHEIGDILLQEVSTRLTRCVRKEDTVARLGGDEFTVLLFDIRSPSDASLVAEKILKTLRQPLNISGHQLVVTTSIGITIVPQDGTDPNSLMKNADLAMYRAKEHGRNIYQFYSEEMNINAIKRLRTEYELRRALDRNEFILYYQPKVRLEDQLVVGVECLIRWDHPDRGILSPYEFIEVAEETGAIVDMGNWIIEEGCRTGKELCDQAGRDIQIAINISPRQFKDPNLVATIRRSLRETGLNPSSMELEITETMLMGDVDAANQTVRQLHDLGVHMAIDDFGTGYSSLNYLKKFPINTVKVDRSFIMDIPSSADDKAITSAVIAMAHRLNMEVVAEGVETRDQLDFLIEHDCEFAQGYLFSKPLPLDNIRHMVQPNVRIMQRQR
jgi:diguanylate cyclase (GGDEF)-like protein/PAS domain S-box-containing protein